MTAEGDKEKWHDYVHPGYLIRIAEKTLIGGFTRIEADQINKQIGDKYVLGTERLEEFQVIIGNNGSTETVIVCLDTYGKVTPKEERTVKESRIELVVK